MWSQGFASAPPTATADSLKARSGNGNGHDSSNGHTGAESDNVNGKVEGHSSNSQSLEGDPSSSCNEPQVRPTDVVVLLMWLFLQR